MIMIIITYMVRLAPLQKAILSLMLNDSMWWSEKISKALERKAQNTHRSIAELINGNSERGPLVFIAGRVANANILKLTDEGKQICRSENITSTHWREFVGVD